MNIKQISFTFIFLIMSPAISVHYYGQVNYESPETQNYNLMKKQLKSGKNCLSGDLYNEVRQSSTSMKYYCQFVCSAYKKYGESNYIQKKYGTKGEKLGEGSFGIVYKYVNSSGTEYAIKIPKSFKYKELFEELNASECIKEKMSSSFLEKMGIIRECVTPSGENPHLIMYYYSMTLEDKMKTDYSDDISTYSTSKKKQLYIDMLYLAAELRELHKIGMAHRDLKPENAMVNKEGIPVLVDFGLTTPNLLNAKTVCGTPLFLDPELITYKNTGGATADIYALGIIYYIMMRGNSGWDKVNAMAMNGGYGTLAYRPNFSSLGLSGEKKFILNMLISSKKSYHADSRWDIEKVYQHLKKALIDLDKPVESKPQYTQQYSQHRVESYQTPKSKVHAPQYKVQIDRHQQVMDEANQALQRARQNQHKNLLPYYVPVQNGRGENLNQYKPSNQAQIVQKVNVVYAQPRVVRVVQLPPKRVVYKGY